MAGDEAVTVARVDVDVGCAVVGAAADELEQEPKAGLHPEPQYAFDEPQYPYLRVNRD